MLSLSARRAWIEISVTRYKPTPKPVALRKESVDRNYIIKITKTTPRVALRKESVDRNCSFGLSCADSVVALRKESVDRNSASLSRFGSNSRSLSARRAWIEIFVP